ncbi:hypothetical protein PMAYCL1PPCAC_13838 [Pristionchus mayeri]|uniref:Peptidase M16 C-terminal domain-containing protein n=1 Tax=Pristionchus mayeri TaxID=1317129 RepID=A0AAN4ZLX3_9BILA|nr:hypothetical protein PMAYCL1PPCAC_13838 [Pristionchus mayeri]
MFRAAVPRLHTSLSCAAPLTREQLNKLPNGLIVASAEQLPRPPRTEQSHLVLMYRAGTRYETNRQTGLVPLIKGLMYYGPTKIGSKHSQIPDGVLISPFCTPDYLGVRLSAPRCHTNLILEVLGNIVAFKDCDLDVLPYALVEKPRHPSFIAGELARLAAYNYGTLAHPTYSSMSDARDHFSDDDLRKFAASHMVADNAILFGANVNHEELMEFGEERVPVNAEPAPRATDSSYVGGERSIKQKKADQTYVSIGGDGAKIGDVSALAVQAVLMASLGSCVVRHNVPVERMGAFADLGKHGASIVVGCNAHSFEGEGLIHVDIGAPSSSINNLVKDVARVFKTLKVNDIEDAKQLAKSKILTSISLLPPSAVIYQLTRQIFTGVTTVSLLAEIDNVTASQVNAAAARVASNFTIASYGNVDNVPSRDQLLDELK